MTAPHSKATTARRTRTSRRSRSTATSAQVATKLPFSVPQARPTPRSSPFFEASPAEPLGGGVEHGAEAVVAEVLAAELQRVHADRVGELVHDRLAGEVVRGGGEGAVGTLAERRVGLVDGDSRRAGTS